MTTQALVLALVIANAGGGGEAPAPPTAPALAGAWQGAVTRDGESTPFALELLPEADGKVLVRATIPSVHVVGQPLGRVAPKIEGDRVTLGPFAFRHDAASGTLTGVLPAGLAPVYELPLTLRRVERIDVPPRPPPGGRLVRPVWARDLGAPLWAGPRYAGGSVYVGGVDGRVHAVDARTGTERWSFRAGGEIRTRPTVADGAVYFQADDGFLYKLGATGGEEIWRVQVVEKPVERLPFDDPKSRYDRFGSDVTASGGRLYLGTHDGRVLALDPATGARLWAYAAGEAVLAAPAVHGDRVYAGSFDGHVHALDATSGALLWKRDTRGAVVSTPAVAGGLVVVGTRAYDLIALHERTGEVAWKRYVWFSWIESSATVRDGVVYVGSSDAAAVLALDLASGRRVWTADVLGWAWGQPVVSDARVFAGTSSQAGYPAGHRAGVVALDRATGKTVWRYESEPAAAGAFGFPGSAAAGEGLVFVGGLDGRLLAFAE